MRVYIVKEQLDDTHTIIRAVFSAIDKAHEYKRECVMSQYNDLEMAYLFPVECWLVDYDFSQNELQ